MTLKFDNKKTVIQFYAGSFNVFIVGGFCVKPNKYFKLGILNLTNNESVIVNERFFKAKDIIDGKRAIKYFDFAIEDKGEYEISLHKFEDMVVKKSMLWLKRLFQKAIEINELEILIEPK